MTQKHILSTFMTGLLLGSCLLLAAPARAENSCLVILTSFSESPIKALVDDYHRQPGSCPVRVIYRRTLPALRLLSQGGRTPVDVVISSSPTFFHALERMDLLAPRVHSTPPPDWLSPHALVLSDKATPVGYSGIGIIYNRDYLKRAHLKVPRTWQALAEPEYRGHLMMSSPSQSGTTHMMVESILQQLGWQQGWALLMKIGSNLASVSARSFGVSEGVARGLVGAGPVIDNYALTSKARFSYVDFHYLPDTVILPTYYAVMKASPHQKMATTFLDYLLSPRGQHIISKTSTAKTPLDSPTLAKGTRFVTDKPQLYGRNQVLKVLFDQVITHQLPRLRQTWQGIYLAQREMKQTTANQAKLAEAIRLASTVPLTEAQALSPELAHVFEEMGQRSDNPESERLTQAWRAQIASQLEQALTLLQTLEYP